MAKQHKRSYPAKKKEIRFHKVEVKSKKAKSFMMWHPAYVFLENDNIFIYVTLTHSDDAEGVTLIKLRKNPNPKDKRDSYYVAEIKEDKRNEFSKIKKGWELDESDDRDIRKMFKKR